MTCARRSGNLWIAAAVEGFSLLLIPKVYPVFSDITILAKWVKSCRGKVVLLRFSAGSGHACEGHGVGFSLFDLFVIAEYFLECPLHEFAQS